MKEVSYVEPLIDEANENESTRLVDRELFEVRG
jgi:hypothetical protein